VNEDEETIDYFKRLEQLNHYRKVKNLTGREIPDRFKDMPEYYQPTPL